MILVTGATGANGTAVIRELASRGLAARALVHDASKSAELVASEWASAVHVVRGDMADADSLGPVLEGMEKVLMISTANEAMLRTQTTFIDAAKQAGVRHVVKFSGRGCWPDSAWIHRVDFSCG
jgi:uncharacterized protein YbjT (DUF2867 family)